MFSNKHFSDFLKVCSVLPVFAVAPAMATDYTIHKVLNADETFGADYKLDSSEHKGLVVTSGANITFDNEVDIKNHNANNANGEISVGLKIGTEKDYSGLGTVTFNGDTEIIATGVASDNGITGARAITIQSNEEEDQKSRVLVNGDDVELTARGSDEAFTLYVSGHASEFESNSTDLEINAETNNSYAQAVTSQYGANINLNAGSNTTINSTAKNSESYAIAVQTYNNGTDNASGTFTSDGVLTVNSNAGRNAFGLYNAAGLANLNGKTVINTTSENGSFGIYNVEGGETNLNGTTTINTTGGSAKGIVGIFNHLGTLTIAGDTTVRAVSSTDSGWANAVSVLSDTQTSGVSKMSIGGNSVRLNATGGINPMTLIVSGHISEFESNASRLNIAASTQTGAFAQAVTAQYGGKITLGADTTTTVSAVANKGAAYGIAVQKYGDETSGTLESNGKLNVAARSYGEAFGAYIADGGTANFAQINVSAVSSNDVAYGVGILNNTTDVKIGAADSVSNLSGTANSKKVGYGLYIENGSGAELNGTVNLSGSTAGMLNDGNVSIAGGTTSGIVLGSGNLTIADNATLNLGTGTLTQGNVDWKGTIAATFLNEKQMGKINATQISGAGTLDLTVGAAGTYRFFANGAATDITFTDNTIYDFKLKDSDIIVSTKSVSDIANNAGISNGAATVVSHLANGTTDAMNEMSLRAQDAIKNGRTAELESAADSINPETASVSQSVATGIQNTVANLAAGRMALPTVGRAGGDDASRGGGIWAQGLYNKTELDGEFDGDTMGVAAGIDTTIGANFTIGAGYATSSSDIEANSRDIDIDSNTLFVYGQYKPSQWYINAMANYTMSEYSENGSLLGVTINADYDVNAFGGRIAAGYDFANGFTPEFGLRYLHISVDDYETSLGIKNKIDDTNYLTATLGAKNVFNIATASNWTIRPELRYAVKYDLVSDELATTVAMPGVDAYVVNGQRLDRLGAELGLGVGVNYNNVDVSLNYEIEIRKDYTSQTGMLKFRYNF